MINIWLRARVSIRTWRQICHEYPLQAPSQWPPSSEVPVVQALLHRCQTRLIQSQYLLTLGCCPCSVRQLLGRSKPASAPVRVQPTADPLATVAYELPVSFGLALLSAPDPDSRFVHTIVYAFVLIISPSFQLLCERFSWVTSTETENIYKYCSIVE